MLTSEYIKSWHDTMAKIFINFVEKPLSFSRGGLSRVRGGLSRVYSKSRPQFSAEMV